MTGDRRILLADADAFYVAVARLVDPDGAGKARLLIVAQSVVFFAFLVQPMLVLNELSDPLRIVLSSISPTSEVYNA